MRSHFILVVPVMLGCGESFLETRETTPDCPPPRVLSAIVTGQVVNAQGDSLPEASVVIESGLAQTAADTVGMCSTVDDVERQAELDASGWFREKLQHVAGSFMCATARGEWNGEQGMSQLAKLELRLDLGPECTPESALDTAVLEVVIGS